MRAHSAEGCGWGYSGLSSVRSSVKIHNPFRTALVATLGVGVGLLVISAVQGLSTILLYVGTALFLSLGLDPVVSFFERRGLPRWLAVTLTVFGILGLFAGVVLIVLPIIVEQITQLVNQITTVINQLNQQGSYEDFLTWAQERLPGVDVELVFQEAQNFVLSNIQNYAGEVWQFSLNILGGLAGAFIVLILTIYLTASTPHLKAAVNQLVPASRRERFVDLSDQITDSVGFYVIGQVSLGLINGILSFIFLNIINAPFAAVLAVVAFFSSLIPLVGTLTGSILIILACLIPDVGSAQTAIAAAIYYFIYMQVEAYFLSPRIMNRAVSIPGAVVVIAALAGAALLGLLGALIAIPVAASLLIIYRQVIIPQQNGR